MLSQVGWGGWVPLFGSRMDPGDGKADRIAELYRKCHKNRVVEETSSKPLIAKIFESNELVIGNLSLIDKAASAATILPHAFASALGTVGSVGFAGAMGVSRGLYMLSHIPQQVYKHYQRDNREGQLEHVARGVIGASYGAYGVATIIAVAAEYTGRSALAASAATAAMAGGLVLYGASGGFSLYGIATNHSFRSQLNALTEHEDAKSLHGALSWLKDLTKGETEKEFYKKWDRFAFRSSEAACRLVRESVTPELLSRLLAKDPKAIIKAQSIITEVKRANAKQLLKHYMYFACALLGIGAAIAAFFLSGPFAPLLATLGVLIWVTLDASQLDQKLGDLFFGESKIPSARILPDEKKKKSA